MKLKIQSQKNHSKCDCMDGSKVNGTKEPMLSSFV